MTSTMKPINYLLLAGILLLGACRGTESQAPPMELNTNMDYQQKFDPQEPNPFFRDNMSMRPPVPGTVARGFYREDTRFYMGKDEGGGYVATVPVTLTREFMERGRQRFNIYCTPCHGAAGDGKGIIMTGGYGFTPAPSFHDPRLRNVQDGYLFDVISNGIRTMPAYGPQISIADRWAIVAYIRALQRSQNASLEDVPANFRGTIQRPATTPGTTSPGADTAGARDTTAAR